MPAMLRVQPVRELTQTDDGGRCEATTLQGHIGPESISMRPTQFFFGQLLAPCLVNAGINGGLAWAQHAQAPAVGLWTQGSYAVDLLATGFLLPAISWLILRPLLRRQQAQGKAPNLDGLRPPRLLPWMPKAAGTGALAVGLYGMLLVGGGATVMATLLGEPSFSGQAYALVKAGYAAVLTLAMQPLMVFAALNRRPA